MVAIIAVPAAAVLSSSHAACWLDVSALCAHSGCDKLVQESLPHKWGVELAANELRQVPEILRIQGPSYPASASLVPGATLLFC